MSTPAKRDYTRTSKFLALILRHEPAKFAITLDHDGWAPVPDVLKALNDGGHRMEGADLAALVAADAKGRYALSPDGSRIRANQGHSTAAVALAMERVEPPDLLYHGTATRFLDAIRAQGLLKMGRQHVHISATHATATEVGRRHGKPVVLPIRARAMHDAGHAFFRSDNGVWLTDHVPADFIDFP